MPIKSAIHGKELADSYTKGVIHDGKAVNSF
jgi:hypothetical protein